MTDKDNNVGYGKPPEAHQFKPGISGNPAGRPKGAKSLKADLLEEMDEQIQLKEGTRKIKISKQRALIKSLMARAIKGNDRAAGKLFDLYLKTVGIDDDTGDADRPLTDDEQDIIKSLEARILRKLVNETDTEDGDAS